MTRVQPFVSTANVLCTPAAPREVRPLRSSPRPQHVRTSRYSVLRTVGGFVYLFATLVLSVIFIRTLSSHTTNDLYWAHFNTTGMQSFVADLCNAKLHLLHATTTIEFNRSMAIPKDYAGSNTLVEVSAARARSFLLQSIPLDQIIPSLQNTSFTSNLMYLTPHCWVDFNQTFEMAHTPKRQRRCQAHDRDNAAVYFESFVRNANPQDITKSSYFPDLNATIFTALYESEAGRTWMEFLHTHQVAPVADEMATWARLGLTKWIVQVINVFQQGLVETITVDNALGITSTITIGSVPFRVRGGAYWTTSRASFGIWNDISICSSEYLGCSLVRSASNHFDAMEIDWDKDIVIGWYSTPSIELVRRHIGPFGSLDLRFVPVPTMLLDLVAAFQREYYDHLQSSPQALASYRDYLAVQVDPVPSAWAGLSFYGGNPLCEGVPPQPYVQETFGFYESCDNSVAYSVSVGRDSAVFALASTGFHSTAIPRICAMCRTTQDACRSAVDVAAQIQASLPSLADFERSQAALLHVAALNVTMMQFGTDHEHDLFLTQPMLDGAALWDFYGWVTMHDWAHGTREVYTFEGDEGSVTVMSPYFAHSEMTANSLEVPQSACKYAWYFAVYVTFLLSSVGAMTVLFGGLIRFRTDPNQLFQFNRVVGSVWIGRPLLLLRGMTAATILSTANQEFIVSHGFSQLAFRHRSLWTVVLLANETLWITYVLVDICLPITQGISSAYAPLSSVLAWSCVAALEFFLPFVPHAVLKSSECTIQRVGKEVHCASGSIAIGSFDRVALICVVSAVAVALAYIMSKLAFSKREADVKAKPVHFMVPGASQRHLLTSHNDQCMDNVACIMSGMIPLRTTLFDVKLWGVMRNATPTSAGFTFPIPGFHRRQTPSPPPPPRDRLRRRNALLGLVYLAATVAGSYVYLILTESTMSNDMWWASFNGTGTQAYLSAWFTWHLSSAKTIPPTILNVAKYATTQWYNLSTATVAVPRLYAGAIQDEVNSLENVVRGLRAMNSCDLPWIFVAHCYVDFDRTWELAPTLAKQLRCRSEIGNGAVYLESLLRNAKWADVARCWGHALDAGVFGALRDTNKGRDWTSMVQRDVYELTVLDEVKYWNTHGVSYFSTQWQNFKLLGVVESYAVRNAFGLHHTFTLKQLNATWQLESETSYKMHWGLANTLLMLSNNRTSLAGRSLVRSSNSFAFQNQTPEVVASDALLLVLPLGSALSAVRGLLGPFGSIDMTRVACPLSLRLLYRNLTGQVAETVHLKASTLQHVSALLKVQSFSPQTKEWSARDLIGGNLMCEYDPRALNFGNDVNEFFTIHGRCNSNLLGTISSPGNVAVMAIIATGLNATDTAATCERDMRFRDGCNVWLSSLVPLTKSLELPNVNDLVRPVLNDIRDTLELALVQFARHRSDQSALDLVLAKLFDPNEPEFDFFSWLYLFEWVEQTREVVAFTGESGRLTTLSGQVPPIAQTVNGMEIPVSVSFYMRYAIQYVTFVFLLVGCLLLCYFVAVRGRVEGWNMMKVNRVAGMVWIGRPLILLRGVTAVILLSTPSLVLEQSPNGLSSYFVSPRRYWLTTFMSSGEACWLVYILNDICSPFTLSHTAYASKSSNLVWLAAFVISMVDPVQHEVSLSRECTVEAVDFQVVCQAGTVYFGSVSRCLQLVSIACASCVLCYIIERRYFVRSIDAHARKSISPFLHAVAIHNLHFANWQYSGVTYMDKATAAMTGILSIELRDTLFLFDIKSWRLYTIVTRDVREAAMDNYLLQAVPLME